MAQFNLGSWKLKALAGKIEMHALGDVRAGEARDGCEGPKRLS